MKRTIALAAALALTAWSGGAMAQAATSAPRQASAGAPFKVGVATQADVISALGAPSSTLSLADGSTIFSYVTVKSHVKAATFIPVVGLFAGGATSTTTSAAYTFGPDGRLASVMTNNSNTNCSTSLASVSCH